MEIESQKEFKGISERVMSLYCYKCKLMIEAPSVIYNSDGMSIHQTCLSLVDYEYFSLINN